MLCKSTKLRYKSFFVGRFIKKNFNWRLLFEKLSLDKVYFYSHYSETRFFVKSIAVV